MTPLLFPWQQTLVPTSMMANETISQRYTAVCDKHEIKINPFILNVLQQTSEAERNFTLNLRGNDNQPVLQRLGDEDVFAMSKCLQNHQAVTGLDLRYNNVSDEGARHLADLIKVENSALRSLNLMFNNIQKEGAELLAGGLQQNHSLMSLKLSGNKLSKKGFVALGRALQRNQTLQELQLADCDLDTTDVLTLSIVLKINQTLRSVDISRPLLFSLQEEWTWSFSEMLETNSSLVELHLGKMGLTDTGLERLARGLKQNRSLRYLDLRCNRVTRDGAQHLAEVLTQNSSLEVLDLSANRIEDEGATCLSGAIARPECPLREFSVCRNNIRTEGLLSLSQAVASASGLTHLYIWGNQLQEPVCRAFSQLISGGHLAPEHTDVSPYQVDGHVFLAEVNQRLRSTLFCLETVGAATS
nr:leucine-rich repeat-containing protein 34 isoform X1 [Nothobranchius furzeri]